jgi:hypothetical protein
LKQKASVSCLALAELALGEDELGAADEGHGQAGAIVPGARPGLPGKETLAGFGRVTVLSRVLAAGACH